VQTMKKKKTKAESELEKLKRHLPALTRKIQERRKQQDEQAAKDEKQQAIDPTAWEGEVTETWDPLTGWTFTYSGKPALGHHGMDPRLTQDGPFWTRVRDGVLYLLGR
jgi:hypothetical protein